VETLHCKPGAWAIVLAAGEGTRLRSLTKSPSGSPVPKQFCSLYEGPCLLREALNRASSIAEPEQTCVVVAEQHRRWWNPELHCLPPGNIIVQPDNRGTANGILLPLLHILHRDPDARVVLLPSDHLVRQETILATSLRSAVAQLRWRFDEILLLGLTPEESDPELGYIVPGRSDGQGALTVSRFVEKPSPPQAAELVGVGALWNAFIVAAAARSLRLLFDERIPEVVARMSNAVQSDLAAGDGMHATAQLYMRLPTLDFSRDILTGQECRLRVLPVPRCGWSDLGTPRRVAEALARSPCPDIAKRLHSDFVGVSLAAQHERMRLEAAQ
jgi:mannose-1-phosphate guanylyltransferase